MNVNAAGQAMDVNAAGQAMDQLSTAGYGPAEHGFHREGRFTALSAKCTEVYSGFCPAGSSPPALGSAQLYIIISERQNR